MKNQTVTINKADLLLDFVQEELDFPIDSFTIITMNKLKEQVQND